MTIVARALIVCGQSKMELDKMTVGELRLALAGLPDHADVLVWGLDTWLADPMVTVQCDAGYELVTIAPGAIDIVPDQSYSVIAMG